jgi:predicted kinase
MLYIIRGIPGSGKSTFAQNLAEDLKIKFFETDQFFTQNGEYKFDPKLLSACHSLCRATTEYELASGHDAIVANTFTTVWEIKGYVDLAVKYGHDVTIIEMTGRYQNIHGVPSEKVAQMEQRFVSNRTLIETEEFSSAAEKVKISFQTV